jgi:hypothetical protein
MAAQALTYSRGAGTLLIFVSQIPHYRNIHNSLPVSYIPGLTIFITKDHFMLTETRPIDNEAEESFMNTLTERINKATKEGYTESFKVTQQGLFSEGSQKTYMPVDVFIKDFFRFEGQSDPADNAILYIIETSDGVKGMLVDAYGAYADENINKFIVEVEEIQKKERKAEGDNEATPQPENKG